MNANCFTTDRLRVSIGTNLPWLPAVCSQSERSVPESAAICTLLGVSVHQMEINIPKACVKTINCQRPLRVKGSVMKAIKKLERSLKRIQQPERVHTRAIAIYYCFTHCALNSVAKTFGDEITFINAWAMNNWLIAQWCRGWQIYVVHITCYDCDEMSTPPKP